MIEQKSSLMHDQQISQKLQIFISGRNLSEGNLFQNIDSFLIIYLSQPSKQKKQVLKTKVYWNDLNPNYAQTLVVDFIFEVRQKLTFQIYHQAKPSKLIGRLETTVGQIFGSTTNGFIKPLKNDKQEERGKIIVRCEKIQKGKRRTFNAQITAKGLPNLTWWYFFGGTCPFFRIFRKRKQDQLLIYESQVINYNTNPIWKQVRLSQQKLCNLDDKLQLQIRVYNHVKNGSHALLGSSYFSLKDLQNTLIFPIFNKKDKKGEIIFKNIKRTTKHQFGDYLQKGLQLALTTCIDFTASNGNPQNKDSLHYSNLVKKSQYQEAMSEVLNILMDYDYDKLVPCFGFGAQVSHPKFNTYGKVHHCFPINGNQDNPDIYQKQNIVKAYKSIFPYIKFSGPTKFSQLLKQAIKNCSNFQKNQHKTEYMILFILTDGQIHDKNEVIDLLVKCNRLPISVIIVGIGNGEFGLMKQLDDDDCQMIDSNGNKTQRDLVQFVEFHKFKNNGVALAQQVLFQLPRQVQQYFELVGVEPSSIKRRIGDIEQQMILSNLKI